MTIIIATSAAVITGFRRRVGSTSVRGLGVHARKGSVMVLNMNAKRAWGDCGRRARIRTCMQRGRTLSGGVGTIGWRPIRFLDQTVIAALALHLGNAVPRASIRYRWDFTGFEKAEVSTAPSAGQLAFSNSGIAAD
mgnify:CR=1 FL=1